MSLYWLQSLASTDSFGSGGGGGGQSQAEVFAAEVLSHSPVAYYKMDEASGAMVDSSTTGNDGTYSGSPTLGVSGPFAGASGVTFNGSSQWASAAYSTALDFSGTDDFSLMFWMNVSTWPAASSHAIGRVGAANWDDYEAYTSPIEEFRSRIYPADELSAGRIDSGDVSGLSLADSAWHMVILTADRSDVGQWWIDAAAAPEAATDISAYDHELTGNKTFYIGRNSVGNYWPGSLCQVAVFPSALSSATVSALWTAAGN